MAALAALAFDIFLFLVSLWEFITAGSVFDLLFSRHFHIVIIEQKLITRDSSLFGPLIKSLLSAKTTVGRTLYFVQHRYREEGTVLPC